MLGKSAYAETGTTQETAANSSQSRVKKEETFHLLRNLLIVQNFISLVADRESIRSLFHVCDIPLMHSETACLAANEKFNSSSYVRRTVVTG